MLEVETPKRLYEIACGIEVKQESGVALYDLLTAW